MMAKKKHWLFKISPRYFSRKIIPALGAVSILLWSAVAVSPGRTLDVFFLDVGQGDAIYGRLPTGEDFLIDGGPSDSVLEELGQVMPPYDREITLMIASHNHADHIKGLISVLERYEIKEIWISGAIHTSRTYINFLEAVNQEKRQGAVVKTVKAGDEKVLGQGKMAVLFPIESMVEVRPDNQHDATVVTRLSYGQIDYLLTGDLDEYHERTILNSQFSVLNSEVFKVPHHGSATGLLEEFLDAIRPKYAVIQVAAQNRYGHPAPSVLSKLKDRSIPAYRTDQNGTITISTDGENIFIKTENGSLSPSEFDG